MSKELTEKYRKGELDYGYYYLQTKDGERRIDRTTCDIGSSIYLWTQTDKNYIQEVLAPVPSYDEVKEMSQKIERLEFDNEALEMAHNEGKKINAELVSKTEQLEKKLEIATNALKEYAYSSNWYETDDFGISAVDQFACEDYGYNIAEKALKEMEGVK